MSRSLAGALGALAFLAPMAEMSAEAASMDDLVWRARPVIVFAPNDGHAILAGQREALSRHDAGLGARDMVLIEVAGEAVTVAGEAAPDWDAQALRARFGVSRHEAVAVLVGKDGGAKLRRDGALAAETLFDTIDAMPMRQREIRERGQ